MISYLDTIADLCHKPFDQARPQVLWGAFNPHELFNEVTIAGVINSTALFDRIRLFTDRQLLNPEEHPEAYTPAGVRGLRRTQTTLLLPGLQRQAGTLRALCRTLQTPGWATVHALAVETPPGEQAFAQHWHPNPTIVCQIRGRQVIHVFERRVDRREYVVRAYKAGLSVTGFATAKHPQLGDQPEFETILLGPGDIYVIPAAWSHYVITQADRSLQVSICPMPVDVYAALANEDHLLEPVAV